MAAGADIRIAVLNQESKYFESGLSVLLAHSAIARDAVCASAIVRGQDAETGMELSSRAGNLMETTSQYSRSKKYFQSGATP